MKKITLLFLFLFIVFFVGGCKKEPSPLVLNFSSKFIAEYNGVTIKGKSVINKSNMISLKITYPKSLKGITYTYKGNSLKIKQDNFILKTEENYLSETSFPSVTKNIFNSLYKENNCYLKGTNQLYAEYKGNSDNGKYNLISEYYMGTIKSISIKNIGYKIKFKEVKISS